MNFEIEPSYGMGVTPTPIILLDIGKIRLAMLATILSVSSFRQWMIPRVQRFRQ